MIRRPSLALLLMAGPALAQEASPLAPDTAVTPEPRPGVVEVSPPGLAEGLPEAAALPSEHEASRETATEEEAPELPDDGSTASEGVPEPNAEPGPAEGPALSPLEEAVAPEAEAPDEGEPAVSEALAESPDELATCLAELDAMGVAWELADPVTEPGNPACGIANPVVLSEIAPGAALEPASPMRCATALAAARWAVDVVVPLGRKLEGRGGVTAIDQGIPYVCRPRADGALSEHATGAALDVMGFRFASGDPIPVQPRAEDGTAEEAFQRAVRAGACLDFPTVLGPGSDEDHADHLHLDVKARDRGFRICE